MMRGRVGSLLVVVSLAVAACGTAATPEATTQTPLPTAGTPLPSTSQPTATAGAISVVTLPLSYNFHTMSSYGSIAVLDEVAGADDGLASDVILVDLAHGTWRVLATAAPGYQPWNPVIGANKVAWVEWRYPSPWLIGSCSWRIVVMDLGTGTSRLIASGVNTRLDFDGAPSPAMDMELDGSRLAYAVQDTTAARPWGWRIKVVDLASGKVERSIPTQQEMFSLGLAHGEVAYSEGLVNTETGAIWHTRLMISTPQEPKPRQIAANAYYLSFRDGRLAWMGDESGAVYNSGQPGAVRVWTAVGPSWTPAPVTPQPPEPQVPQEWQAVSADAVVYCLVRLVGSGGSSLWMWDARTGQAHEVPGSEGAMASGIGQGWVTWAGGVIGTSVTVSGMRLP